MVKQLVYLTVSGLIERLDVGETIISAEGYLMELDRRGYNKNGHFIPTVRSVI